METQWLDRPGAEGTWRPPIMSPHSAHRRPYASAFIRRALSACHLVTLQVSNLRESIYFFQNFFFPILLEVNYNYIFVFEKLIPPLRFESCRVTRQQANKARRINALAKDLKGFKSEGRG